MRTSPFKVARVKRGFSQGELANQTKIPRWRISMFETGVLKLRDDELRRLSKILESDFHNPSF